MVSLCEGGELCGPLSSYDRFRIGKFGNLGGRICLTCDEGRACQ